MKIVYSNRDRDKITFEDLDNTVRMSGYFELGMRYGFEELEGGRKITMIDPSGGPYILLGDNLVEFFNDSTNRLIESIDIQEGYILFTLKK